MSRRITLKNIKHAAFASQETDCYEASVYFDDKKVGTVSNDGHGGCDYEYPTDKAAWKKMEDYISTLPKEEQYGLDQSLELICGDLVNEWLTAKDLKRALSKKVLFQKIGKEGLFQTKPARNKETLQNWIKQIGERSDTQVVLNRIPFDSALNIYVENAS